MVELLSKGKGGDMMSTNLNDLLDCPFCGGKAIRVQHPGTNWGGEEGKYINIGASHGLWYMIIEGVVR